MYQKHNISIYYSKDKFKGGISMKIYTLENKNEVLASILSIITLLYFRVNISSSDTRYTGIFEIFFILLHYHCTIFFNGDSHLILYIV